MMRCTAIAGLALAVIAPRTARAQAPTPDPQVAKGIAQVEDGDHAHVPLPLVQAAGLPSGSRTRAE